MLHKKTYLALDYTKLVKGTDEFQNWILARLHIIEKHFIKDKLCKRLYDEIVANFIKQNRISFKLSTDFDVTIKL